MFPMPLDSAYAQLQALVAVVMGADSIVSAFPCHGKGRSVSDVLSTVWLPCVGSLGVGNLNRDQGSGEAENQPETRGRARRRILPSLRAWVRANQGESLLS